MPEIAIKFTLSRIGQNRRIDASAIILNSGRVRYRPASDRPASTLVDVFASHSTESAIAYRTKQYTSSTACRKTLQYSIVNYSADRFIFPLQISTLTIPYRIARNRSLNKQAILCRFDVGKLYTSKTIAISCKRQNAMESYTCKTWHGDCYI